MRIIRNIFRRKLRAFLTIFGITIGVFALVVMGSMAEKINLLVDGGTRYYSDKVAIADASTMTGSISTTPIAVDRIGEIEAVDGVARASASIYMLLDHEGGMAMGVPQGIIGTDLRDANYEEFKLSMRDGRDLAPGDRGKAVVGSDLAKALGAEVGKTIELRGKPFEVVGIYDKTLTAPDNTVSISLADAQDLLFAQLPAIVQQQVDRDRPGHRHHRLSRARCRRRPARLDHPGHGARHQGFRAPGLQRPVQERAPGSSTPSSSAWLSSRSWWAASPWSTP